MPTPIRFVIAGDYKHRPSTYNRALGDVLDGSGYLADGSDFAGFAKAFPALTGEVGVTSTQYPVGDVRRYGLVGGVNESALLANALASLAALGGGTLLFSQPVTYRFDTTVTITVPVQMAAGAKIQPGAAATLTFSGAMSLPLAQVFDVSLGGRIILSRGTVAEVIPQWWGAVGNGISDDTAAIQAAIDCVIYGPTRCRVVIPAGQYRTTDTIHLGYGGGSTSVTVEGGGWAYAGSTAFNGTTILPDRYDRPTFNIQAARGSRLAKLAIYGKLGAYYAANSFGQLNGAAVGYDDTLAATWDDPTYGGAALDTRYAPYAAITVDAYSGVRPATSYPDVTYPAWTGIVTQYGKSFSSDVRVSDVFIEGFTVALAVQPGDSDGNGDFIALERSTVVRCKYGISVGNAQSRNVSVTDLKAAIYHTLFVGSKHGRQIGAFGSPVINASVGAGINILDIPQAGFSQGMTFINLYCEAQWRLGIIGAGSSGNLGFVFKGGSLSFNGGNDVRGYPSMILGPSDTSVSGLPVDIAFEQVTISVPNICQFAHQGVSLDGVTFVSEGARTNPYQKFAHNALAGGLVTYRLHTPRRSRVRFSYYNLDTGALVSTKMTDRWDAGSRTSCIPFTVEAVVAASETDDPTLGRPSARTTGIAKSTLTGASLVGRTLTFTMTALSDAQALQHGPLPGDVLWDDTTGSVFFVRSRVTTTIIAELQNNYKVVAGTATPIIPLVLGSGTLYVRSSRLYTPQYYLRADLATGSATLTNVARDDGFAAWFNTDIAVGDALMVRDTQDAFVSLGGAVINARDHTVPSITLAAAPPRAQTRRRLDFFCRTGPANV